MENEESWFGSSIKYVEECCFVMEVDVWGERFEVEIWFWFMSLMEVGHFKSKRVDRNANTYVQSEPGIFPGYRSLVFVYWNLGYAKK